MFHPGKFIKKLGPGIITGASDDDPSGVITYSQTGAEFGYRYLWLSLFTMPLMMAVQEMSARIGLVARKGLSRVIRERISARVAITLALGLFVVNTINISADLNAMVTVLKLVLPGPAVVYLFGFAILILVLEVRVTYAKYANVLKWLTVTLLGYVLVALLTKQDWGAITWHTFIPTINGGWSSWYLITAILGTTISPYLFYWQASEEVEEENLWRQVKDRAKLGDHIKTMRQDTAIGMLLSNIIMFFIIVATAGTLHAAGITNIATAEQAASALKPLAGSGAFWLFALGILGTGMLAIPVLAGSAAYALAEVFRWHEGLGKAFRRARGFYFVISLAIIGGAIASTSGIDAIHFLILAAVLNGFLAPVVIWFLLRLANDPKVVGSHRTPPLVAIGGWVAFFALSIAGVFTIIQRLF